MSDPGPRVSVIMGSRSDLPVMKGAVDVLKEMGVTSEVRIVSAHRTTARMMRFALEASSRGVKVIIAGAGGAAHLPGMIASLTIIPVIGVPVHSKNSFLGWDSILSILQMPRGVPVATVALDAAENAGLLACQILGLSDPGIQERLQEYRKNSESQVDSDDKKTAGGDLG